MCALRRSPYSSVASLLLLLTASDLASAQQAAGALEEVIVTARKREEAAVDVPTSLQVLSGEALTREGIRSFSQVQQQIPNFYFASDQAGRSTSTIRGYGASPATTLAGGVGLYVDGVYQASTAFFNVPFFDLERMEVLKGPQGTLFGRNAYAGAINIVTRRPDNELELNAQAEIANGDTQRLFAGVGGPLIEGRLSGRLSGGVQKRRGFFEYESSGGPADERDYSVARGRLALDATERLSFDLTAQYLDLDEQGFTFHAIGSPDETRENIQLNPPQPGKVEFFDTWLIGTWAGERFEIVSQSAFGDQSNDTVFDVDFTSNEIFRQAIATERRRFTQELRLQSGGEGRLRWLTGVYFEDAETERIARNSGALFPAGPLMTIGNEDARIRAVFADIAWDITEKLELGLGLRYDEVEKTADSTTVVSTPVGSVTLPTRVLDDTYTAAQPKASLRYRVSDEGSVYASFARGFREGGFNLNAFNTPLQSFDSDEIEAYELGYKHAAADGRWTFDAAAFFMESEKFNWFGFFVSPTTGAQLVTLPIGALESYGIETGFSAAISEYVSITFSGGYNKTEYTSVEPAGGTLIGITEGDPAAFTPEWSLAASARGSFPLRWRQGMTFEIAASVGTKGDVLLAKSASGAQSFYRDPETLVDMSLGLAAQHWRVALFGRNLTDARYAEIFQPQDLLAIFGSTTGAGQYNEPRTYGIRMEIFL